MLATIDLILIAFYFLVLLIIGYLASQNQSTESFLISERKLNAVSGMMTINATKTGSIIFLITALLYEYGSSAAWYFAGAMAGYTLFLYFSKHLLECSQGTYYTLGEYFRNQYGSRAGMAAVLISLIPLFGFLVLNMIAATKVLTFFTSLSFLTAAFIISGTILVYLLLAGFHAVVATDMLQYGAIVTIFVLFAIVLSQGLTIPTSEWNVVTAGAKNIFGFFLIGMLIPFASPELWQRAYAIKDYVTLKTSILFSIMTYGAAAAVIVIVGLFVKTAFPGIDPDTALMQGLTTLLSPGLVGLAIVVFFAALMSTIDTYAYTVSSSLVQDFRKHLGKSETVSAIRRMIFVVIAAATIFVIFLQDLRLAAFIFIAYSVVLAIPALVTWVKPSVNRTTLVTAFVVGAVFLSFFVILGVLDQALNPIIVLQAIAGSILGLGIGALVTYIIKKRQVA